MKNLVLCTPLSVLFFISAVHSAIELTPGAEVVNFTPKQSIRLVCNVSYAGGARPDIEWYKDEKKIATKDPKSRVKSSWENTENILSISESNDNDAGNYSCSALVKGEEKARAEIITIRTIAVKVPTNVNVVEEERLRIECKVLGNPKLTWIFKNQTYNESRDRVTLEDYTDDGRKIEKGVFIVEKAEKDDRGNVTCIGEDLYSHVTDEKNCMVRVKDKYAALWPFLGICAEVIVLCAVIVIYEKKRNKTELEESDTDQSPDQKNTPDHGKEANLRHRQ